MSKTIFYILSPILLFTTVFAVQHCDVRGGCYCDCSWASASACLHDDGSCCFACCCGGSPPPPPPPPPPPVSLDTYCPSANDITVAYGQPNIFDQGWSINGGGAAATKASFNLLGGNVEFDIDVSGVRTGVNANIYTISPNGIGSAGFSQNNYCDGAKPAGSQWCVEVDWIESNGNCGGQTTLHDIPGPGSNGCTAWGCASKYHYNGRASFHMKVTFETNGVWNTYRDGELISPSSLSPSPSGADWATLVQHYSQRGAVVYSSQWVGWVPVDDCGTQSGDLGASAFSVKNLRITGKVLQGPVPRKCNGARE